ncbi:glycoside hydrolase family 16 protein [Tomitella gaofuii]|uniref:glycoside hydrolase family 16 protein n=1 Tax=Tomitella gaofuii TaxID=2760083 RepID=UPI0015F9CDAD|nr:glycoside hydrolase family 16 protein [Tomitella gaofuii]
MAAAAAAVVLALTSACTVNVSLGHEGRDGAASAASPTVSPRPTARPGGAHAFDEQFDGARLDMSRWSTCYWWQEDGGCTIASNNELEWYRPEQVSVRGGALVLTAQHRTVSGDGDTFPYVSGVVTTGPPKHDAPPKYTFTYGTVEVRFQIPRGAGLWQAIWLLPASESSVPEIDMMEAVGQLPGEANMYFHPGDRAQSVSGQTVALPEGADLSQTWHTVRLDWSPGLLVYSLDGAEEWRVTGDQVPSEPMYLLLNLAVGGVYGGQPDASAFPAEFLVDSVRIEPAGEQ